MTAVTEKKKRTKPVYGLPEVTRGLTAVAYANGNFAKAARDLREDGWTIEDKTLSRWVNGKHKADYERIRREVLPIVGAQTADEHMALARKQIGIASQLADRLLENADQLEPKDLAGAMRNADVGSGIHTEKARDLAGDFETPAKSRSAEEILRSLFSKLGKEPPKYVDSTVTEIEPQASDSEGDHKRDTENTA